MTLSRWVVLLVVAASAVSCTNGEAACDRIAGVRQGLCITAPEVRQPAPTTHGDLLGDEGTLTLEAFRGQVVVVNFWASWCGPCRSEQPALNAAFEELRELDVAFVGVDLQDREPNAVAHVEEFEIPYPSIFDPANAYAAKFRGVSPSSIPSTVLLDREGRVAVLIRGETRTSEVVGLARTLAAEAPT